MTRVLTTVFFFIIFSGNFYARASPDLRIFLSDQTVVFHVHGRTGNFVEADKPVRINALSDPDEWSLNYQSLRLQGRKGVIPPAHILISTPYTGGYLRADTPRLAAMVGRITSPAKEVSRLRFRLFLTGRERPGKYSGVISSPDGGPPIQVRVIIEPFETKKIRRALTNTISFISTGAGAFHARKDISIALQSGSNRNIRVEATPLTKGDYRLPPERLMVNGAPLPATVRLSGDNSLKFSDLCG